MKNLNICVSCHQGGTLVPCDSCPRSYHRYCFRGKIDMSKDFDCGRCNKPIPDIFTKINNGYTDISESCEEIKRGLKEYYNNHYDEFNYRAKYNRCSSRTASSSLRNREQLKKDQGGYCAGLLMANGTYRPCHNLWTECDHIIELRHGGFDRIEYLQGLCSSCHCDKTAANFFGQFKW